MMESVSVKMEPVMESVSVKEADTELSGGSKRKFPEEPEGEGEQSQEKPKVKHSFVTYINESEVGISQFVGIHPGFTCTLKERYSDFIVHEKSLMGKLIALDSFEVPIYEEPSDDSQGQLKLISEEMILELDKLVDGSRTQPLRIQVDDISKEDRRMYHQFVKDKYPTLKSDTVDFGNHKYIQIAKKDGSYSERRVDPWPKGRPDYCHFVLYKENMDTVSALFALCRVLKKSINQFSYAGVKDRRAITSQSVSVRRIPAEELIQVNAKLNAVKVGNFEYKKEFLHLGDLTGNHFELILRNSEGSKEDVDTSMQSLRDNGFINYFGMQRFGSTSVPSFRIGQSFLHGDHKKVVDLILQPREDARNSNITKCRDIWQSTRNARKAFNALNARNTIEGRLLTGLINVQRSDRKYYRNKRDDPFAAAIDHIPANVRSMYVHSYQSYIWNKVASKRILQLGLRPAVGDLFIKDKFCDQAFESDSPEKSRKEQVKHLEPEFVTEENISSVQLKDIVLPIPGYKVKYPKNEAGEWFKTFLSEDNLYSSNHRNFQEVGLPGSYRRLIVIPSDMEWEVYEGADSDNLVVTDYMKLSPSTADSHAIKHSDKKHKGDESLQAVKLCFTLPPSSYATMAVREATKLERNVLCQAAGAAGDGYSSGEEEEALKQGEEERVEDIREESPDRELDKYAWV